MARALFVAVLSVALCVGGGAARSSTPSGRWLPPTVVDPLGGHSAEVALAPGGVAVAAWSRNVTRVSTRGTNHEWVQSSTPVAGDLLFQRLAIDGSGDALLTGVQQDGSNWKVVAFERTAGLTTWSGPIAVAPPAYDPGPPDLAVNAAGQAAVAWTSTGNRGELAVARAALRRSDGSWESPQNLGYASGSSSPPSVALDGQGDALVAWTRGSSLDDAVYTEFRPAGRAWEPAVVVAQHAIDDNVAVRMNRRGDALVIWGDRDASGRYTLVSSLRPAGTVGWTLPTPIPVDEPLEALSSFYGLSFALDDSGNATLVARRGNGEVEAATQANGASWVGPVRLGDAGSSEPSLTDHWCVHPEIALDAKGDAVVLWGGADLHAARHQAGTSAWEPAQLVARGPACFELAVAADAAGNAVAIWNATAEAVTRLDAVVLDVTPPVLKKVAVPRTAPGGRRVRFTVAASDLWSALAGRPLWQFGDGTSGHGFTLQHVFRRPASYRVRVTAVDQAGNAASLAATVRVTAKR